MALGDEEIKNGVLESLEAIEVEEEVRIFYACEAGSRAWGFPSEDSDYDVRFLYLHDTDWYLSIQDRQDTIECPGHPLDIRGWDLRKALGLLQKGNPPLIEWLHSPIVYKRETTMPLRIKMLASKYYSTVAALYHYYHMARGNYRDYLKGPIVWLKKYFYVLRPLLAVNWLERGLGPVPVEFQVLIDATVPRSPLRREIDKLLEAKRQGKELGRGLSNQIIGFFIECELGRLEGKRFELEYDKHAIPVSELDDLFRLALEKMWPGK